jgi:hypothetical protein
MAVDLVKIVLGMFALPTILWLLTYLGEFVAWTALESVVGVPVMDPGDFLRPFLYT